MNKKLLTILLVAVFLIASVSFISAADTSDDEISVSKNIPVKIKWNDNDQTDHRPSSVTVSLIKDGSVVDTKTLSEENSWSATFNVDGDGSFSVKQSEISDYSTSTSGSSSSGFVIINKLNAEVLGAAEDDTPLEENDTSATDNENTNNNAQGENDTNNTDENNTDDTTQEENTTGDNGTDDAPVVISQKKETKDIIKETVKKPDKKPEKQKPAQKAKTKNTGLPIVVLIIAVMVVAFIPFVRKK